MSDQPPKPQSFSESLRPKAATILQPIGRTLIRLHITANMLTFSGMVLAVGVGVLVATGNLFIGGVLLIIAASMDAFDGTVARLSGIKSKFGAFWDSTLDRYSESFVLLGILIYGLNVQNNWMVVLTFMAVMGSILVSYARSRAETLGIDCKVGVLTRLERIVITVLMLLFYPNVPLLIGLGLIAVLANFTVIQRIVYVRREMERRGI